jgi:putative transposase
MLKKHRASGTVEAKWQMQQVEQHIIAKSDPRWQVIDAVCFLSKNLYNAALYELQQYFFATDKTRSYNQMDKHLKQNVDYCALPRKVSQWVLRQVDHDWQAFWAANAVYKQTPEKFTGRPQLPRYKHKTDGRNLLTYTRQALSKTKLQQDIIAPSQLDIEIRTQVDPETIQQVRIVPRKTHYVVEVVYTATFSLAPANPNKVAGIDVGLNNLAAVTFNQPGLRPLLVNGRPLKSINQHYNKVRAKLQAQLPPGQFTSQRLERLTDQRNRQVTHYLHQASRHLIQELVKHGIGTLIIGKNDGWKQGIDMGKRNNQQFVQIPHARFIEMLTYKAEREGMAVILTEESYTSKCSFLDNESLHKHEHYLGKRIHRGLFRASDGRLLNADVNGSANIIRKVVPNAFANGIEAVVVSPVRVSLA